MKRLFFALATALVVFAADPSGVWKTTVEQPDGTKAEIVYDLSFKEGRILGTIYTPVGEMHIIEGKIDGDKIQFTAEFADTHIEHTGTFTATEMKLESVMVNQKTQLTLKKS